MAEGSNFETLVSGITPQERESLLSKITAGSEDSYDVLDDDEDFANKNSPSIDLRVKLSEEPLIFRIFLAIKSFFQSISVEKLYSDSLVSNLARSVMKTHPDLLDYKNNSLLTTFYVKVCELKDVADFFRGGIAGYEQNPGEFYVFLGTLMVPSISEKIDKVANPYAFDLAEEVPKDQRQILIRNMEDVLYSILPEEKSKLYSAVKSLEWLKSFVKLPFEHLSTRFFSIVSGVYTCPLDAVSIELEAFARVLSSSVKVFPELFETMYLLSNQAKEDEQAGFDLKVKAEEYLRQSTEKISIIKVFIKSIPIKKLAAIAVGDVSWTPANLDGVEDWFVKYKAQMRKDFDRSWQSWLKDKKKFITKEHLKKILNVENYPFLPNRPWTEIWGGIPFSREYTVGYVNSFYEKVYPSIGADLKILMIEGEFAERDSRIEFTDNFNSINHLQQTLMELNENLSERGAIGTAFDTVIRESIRTIQGQQKIDNLMLTVESESAMIVNKFCDSMQKLVAILNGVTSDDEKTSGKRGMLVNINIIQGRNNAAFRKRLTDIIKILLESLDIIKELESIELNTT